MSSGLHSRQAQKLLEMNVTFVGADHSKLAVLSGGNVTSP